MDREEIRNKIFEHLKQQVAWIEANENKTQQFQLSQIYNLFPTGSEPSWKHQKIYATAREIIQELENGGFIYEGIAGSFDGNMSNYPWFTITKYGKEAFQQEDWLPYDPEGYVKALKEKVPDIDDITLAYIGESITAYNRRHLLSATLTLGVASENLMLLLIEAYLSWIKAPKRKADLEKKIKDRFIYTQYKEFKLEFVNDIKNLPKELQGDWETYLDGVFNFIRLNRNSAGHPTGKKLDPKIVNAFLQIFSEYTSYIFQLIKYFS